MWVNAAQMYILSLNWWRYAGRVWSHANSAQPPNSHLAPTLKINTAHWNNSVHIGGTWYCPSDPYTSSVCARLSQPEEPWQDEACSRPGSAPFLAELQPTPRGQHCLVQLRWKGDHLCLGSRLTFDPKHAQMGSCLDSELASPWPQHPVGPKRLVPHPHPTPVHDDLSPPPMVDSTPYHDWRDTISIIMLDAGIIQPPPCLQYNATFSNLLCDDFVII